jgi:hypothetical protein
MKKRIIYFNETNIPLKPRKDGIYKFNRLEIVNRIAIQKLINKFYNNKKYGFQLSYLR